MEKVTSERKAVDYGMLESLCRRLVHKVLEGIEVGCLVLKDGLDTHTFGNPQDSLHAVIEVTNAKMYRQFVLGGSVGAAEAYIEGHWQAESLTRVIEVFAANQHQLDRFERRFSFISSLVYKLKHLKNRNSQAGSKRNILAHYDLGNDLYSAFLSPEMMYSSAIYPSPQTDLAEAQQHKLKTICEKLALSENDHLLEIGTGWGALAIFAAEHYGCRVTTTTISDAQFEYTRALIKEKGLQDKITLLKKDYRELSGKYDKLVSIEMIEAVGHAYLDTFFKKCQSLLKQDGVMLLQVITIADQRFESYLRRSDFIQQYIFPGGCLPSVNVLSEKLCNNTRLVIDNISDIGFHYAQTLYDWRKRFIEAWPAIRTQGFDERFHRLWLFYLCYCEGGFRQRAVSAIHLVARAQQYRSKDDEVALSY